MSADDLLTRTLWRRIGRDLRGGAGRWWKRHEDTLTGLTKDELYDVATMLRAGDSRGAREAIVARMTRDEWKRYVAGTTEQLEGIAARRVAALKALGELGWWAARAIAKAILAAVVV